MHSKLQGTLERGGAIGADLRAKQHLASAASKSRLVPAGMDTVLPVLPGLDERRALA